MKATFGFLFLFIGLSFALTSCNGTNKNFSEEQLRQDLLGDWIMTDIPAAEEIWQFRSDGTYRMQMGDYEDYGTWQLNRRDLVLDQKKGEAEEVFIENNLLSWGNYTFKRVGSAATTTTSTPSSKPLTLTGKWKLASEEDVTIYEFSANNTYSVTMGTGADALEYSGTWEKKDGKIVLDGHDESASEYEFKNNRLVWREDKYVPMDQPTIAATAASNTNPTFQQLVGTWTTKELNPNAEVRFTFRSDGSFTSFDGRYEAKGTWKLDGKNLILDDYKGSASPITISGNQLTWDEVTYQRK